MRIPTLIVAALALLLLGSACVGANRVVTNTQGPVSPGEDKLHKVSWQSDLYEPQRSSGRRSYITDCYDQAIEGQPLPDACITRSVLLEETGAFRRSPVIAPALLLVVLGGLLWYSRRQIAYLPPQELEVLPQTAPASSGLEGTRSTASRLLVAGEAAREAHTEAWAERSDLRRPGAIGLIFGLALTIVPAAIFGFGTGIEWAFVTSAVVGFFVGSIYLATFLAMVPARVQLDPLYQRLGFFAGIAISMLGLSILLMWQHLWFYRWNGVTWPF
jgi:hypothetical protein